MKITTTTNLLITLGILSAVVPILGLVAAACFLLAAFVCAIVAVSQGQPGAVRLLLSAIIGVPLAVVVNVAVMAAFGA